MLKCEFGQWPLGKNKYLNTALNCGSSQSKISSGFMLPNAEMASWTVGISIGFTLNYIKTPSPTVVSPWKIQWFQATKFWHNILNSGVSLKNPVVSCFQMLKHRLEQSNCKLSHQKHSSGFTLTYVKMPFPTVVSCCKISSGFPLPILDTTSWTVVFH